MTEPDDRAIASSLSSLVDDFSGDLSKWPDSYWATVEPGRAKLSVPQDKTKWVAPEIEGKEAIDPDAVGGYAARLETAVNYGVYNDDHFYCHLTLPEYKNGRNVSVRYTGSSGHMEFECSGYPSTLDASIKDNDGFKWLDSAQISEKTLWLQFLSKGGVIDFLYSTNGVKWTSLGVVSPVGGLGSGYITISVSTYDNEDSVDMYVSNVNVPPPVGEIWDGTKWKYPDLWNGTRWVPGHEAEAWNGTQWVPLGRPEPAESQWPERPTEWLPIEIYKGEQAVQVLTHVDPAETAGVSFAVTCAGGYKVDWGDGSSVEMFASDAVAFHSYAGSALPAETLTSDGKRQAAAKITPQLGSSVLTRCKIEKVPSGVDGTVEIVAGPKTLEGVGPLENSFSTSINVRHIEMLTPVTFNFPYAFTSLSKLERVTGNISLGQSSAVGMFKNCSSLTTVPQLDTKNVTDFTEMFRSCRKLEDIPQLDTSNGTDFTFMFFSCQLMTTFPQLDTSKGTIFNSMFYDCSSMMVAPDLDTSNGTDFKDMFNRCTALTTVPQLDTSNGTIFTTMFYNCSVLAEIPQLDTGKGIEFNNMFYMCESLKTIPQLNTGNGVNFRSMFFNCYALTNLPSLDMRNGTGFGSLLSGCKALVEFLPYGIRYSLSVSGSQLDAAALNTLFTNLGTAADAAQKITITGTPGAASCDRSIATAKGWTVIE